MPSLLSSAVVKVIFKMKTVNLIKITFNIVYVCLKNCLIRVIKVVIRHLILACNLIYHADCYGSSIII